MSSDLEQIRRGGWRMQKIWTITRAQKTQPAIAFFHDRTPWTALRYPNRILPGVFLSPGLRGHPADKENQKKTYDGISHEGSSTD